MDWNSAHELNIAHYSQWEQEISSFMKWAGINNPRTDGGPPSPSPDGGQWSELKVQTQHAKHV